MAGTGAWRGCCAWIPPRSVAGASSCSRASSSADGSVGRAEAASRSKKKPAIAEALRTLLARETAGDPCGGAKWSRRSTRKLAQSLCEQGFQISARTVSRLLLRAGFSLRVNRKQLAHATHPDRDAQFRRIAALRARCRAERVPIISVDAKKNELVGNFRNAGLAWNDQPTEVNDHDFRSQADGLAVPYGTTPSARLQTRKLFLRQP